MRTSRKRGLTNSGSPEQSLPPNVNGTGHCPRWEGRYSRQYRPSNSNKIFHRGRYRPPNRPLSTVPASVDDNGLPNVDGTGHRPWYQPRHRRLYRPTHRSPSTVPASPPATATVPAFPPSTVASTVGGGW